MLFGLKPIPKELHSAIPPKVLDMQTLFLDGNLYLEAGRAFEEYPLKIQDFLIELNYIFNILDRFSFDTILMKGYDN